MTIKSPPNSSGAAILASLAAGASVIPQSNGGTGSTSVLAALNSANALSLSPTPRSALAAVTAIASPIGWWSPREAFSDSARQTPCVDGSLVATMRDISGNGNDAAQTTSTSRPTFRAAGINNLLPGMDSQTQNPARGQMKVTGVMANAAFSTGYTIYAVGTSPGIKNVASYLTSSVSVLASISNGDYLGLQNNNQFPFNGNVGGGTGIVNANISYGDGFQDYSGVYALGYDGVTGTVGRNGQYISRAIAHANVNTGDFYFGDYQGATPNFTWTGLVGDVLLFAGKHTQAQMDAIGAILMADSGLAVPAFTAIGDSITRGANLATPTTMNWFNQMVLLLGANSSNCLVTNYGTDSEQAATMITDATGSPYNRPMLGSVVRGNQNIAFIFAGTNDMSASSGSPVSGAVAFSRLQTLCALYRSVSCKVAVGTAIARTAANAGAGFEAQRQIFNNLIYAAGSSLYDILIDFGGPSSPFGTVAALTNTTIYQGDQIHPTEAGSAVMAQMAATAVMNSSSTAPIVLSLSQKALPSGSYPGSYQQQYAPVYLMGTTAGTIAWSMPEQVSTKKTFVAKAAAYENNSATPQTITFPTPFIFTPTVEVNDTGLTLTVSTTTLTIGAPNNTTTFTGNIKIGGM